jgi:hypothetical protein
MTKKRHGRDLENTRWLEELLLRVQDQVFALLKKGPRTRVFETPQGSRGADQ